MTRSPAKRRKSSPRPVVTGRYRYSKLRWRVSVRAFDVLGAAAIRLWRLARPRPEAPTPARVLVVQLDHLGDAVLTTPLLSRLRSAYPEALIDVLASPSNYEVFQADPNVARVHLATKTWFERARGRWALLSAVWSLGRSLRGERYDLGVDVRGDILSVLVLTIAGIPRRVGWTMGGGGFLLTDVAGWVPGRHEVDSRLALLTALGVDVEADGPPRVSIQVLDDDRVEIARRLALAWPEPKAKVASAAGLRTSPVISFPPYEGGIEGGSGPSRSGPESTPSHSPLLRGRVLFDEPDALHAGRFGAPAPLLAIHLGAGTAAKRWPVAYWKTVVTRFLDDGWRVAVVGGPDEDDASATLGAHPNLRDWTGQLSVTQTTALLERADLFIGADSGPSHLAASAGVPSVVLFSGTNRAAQWRPWSRRSLVLRHDVPCRPCHHKVCPLADHPCMTGLDPDRVYRSARRWWARLHREESPHAPL